MLFDKLLMLLSQIKVILALSPLICQKPVGKSAVIGASKLVPTVVGSTCKYAASTPLITLLLVTPNGA